MLQFDRRASPRHFGPPGDHSTVQRPDSRRLQRQPQGPQITQPHQQVHLRRSALPWHTWPEVTVRLGGLLPTETTYSLWKNFATEGDIVLIELFEGRDGNRDRKGKIKFSPPPKKAFWTTRNGSYTITMENGERVNITVTLDDRRSNFDIQSPIKKWKFYEPKMKLFPSALHFGMLVNPTAMMSLRRLQPEQRSDMTFMLDLQRNRIVAAFMVPFRDPRSQGDKDFVSNLAVGQYDRDNKYMFQIPFGQLKTIHRLAIPNSNSFALLISLDSPPQYFRKREDSTAGHFPENPLWTEFETWYRQTDIVYDPYQLQNAKVTLHKERPVIDIGRWTTYLFVFPIQSTDDFIYDEMKQALQDFNIEIVNIDNLQNVPAYPAELWSYIDPPKSQGVALELGYLDGHGNAIVLPFEVRYQLEVCISREILNEYNITMAFVTKLSEIASKDPAKARNILEYVAEVDKRIFDPMTIFEDQDALAFSPKTEIPHYCAYSRKVTITPSTIYFSSPTVETTNRVLRHFVRENQDGRFLRVQFTDEIFEGRINSCADKQRNDELFTRVYRTLFNGIQIGDRHYEFLAFGNSQFRENGAYFFCPTEHLSCNDIRQWMGSFSHISVVAKYAARLGQCFSTTRAINGLSRPDIVKIPDIERNGFCFTDGVGKISGFLAQMIAAELGLRSQTAPSAFQFRLGGCKGIFVVSKDAKEKEVHIRPSQQKFAATYNGLEIIRCARFSCATLNRQTITILSSLGVPDEVFLKMLSDQLANYQNAMIDDNLAVSLLLRYIDDNQMTINIATMIRNCFMVEKDPFVMSLLHLWRSWSIKLLKEKAKIIVENGAFVLGCVDETATLRGYTSPKVARGEQFSLEDLPQIFIQVPDKANPNKYNVIEGICLVGRNPSLHPGDLRVVQAVNVEDLHHLRDVVVFPQTGERDVPSMCSGGDLDGDDFFVLWDRGLQPPEWNCDPMNYAAPKLKEQNRPVEITDLMKFFVRFMKNDSLPTIAHAHLAQSDYLNDSVKDPKCLELARLHSKAVDYVKTGQPAEMPKRLRPGKWPHFMEKKYKPKEAIYHSECILGQLYDKVESVDFVPQYEQPFDKRILRAYKLDDGLLKTVRQIKTQYDTYMRRIMAQHEIKTEFEVWSTFVLSRPRVGSDYKLQEEIGRISEDLKAQFRLVCIEKAGGKNFAVLGPFVAGMYKVTKEEMDIALAECRATKIVSGREVPKRKMEPKSMPLITFPWLFEKELGRIATGIDTSDDFGDLGLLPLTLKGDGHSRKRQGGGEINFDDFIQQEDGVIVHRGEELDLFRPDVDDSYDFSGDNDYEEARSVRGEHGYKIGESGEVVLDATFNVSNVPEHLLSGTGVEEVVPRTELDGFVDPQVAAKALHETSGLGSPYFNDWQQVQLSAGSSSQRKVSPSLGLIDDSDNPVNSHSNPHTDAANGNPLYPSMKDLALLEPEPAQAFEEEIIDEEVVDLDVGESPLEKLARMVGDESSGERPLSSEDEVIEVEEEIVDLEIEESPLEKLARKMDGQSASAETSSVSQRDVVEESEEVVDVDVGESSLEKLARMMGS